MATDQFLNTNPPSEKALNLRMPGDNSWQHVFGTIYGTVVTVLVFAKGLVLKLVRIAQPAEAISAATASSNGFSPAAQPKARRFAPHQFLSRMFHMKRRVAR